jgi:hypothetical protein
MPLVQISHAERVGEAVHRAMVNAIGIPEDDHFQIITEHEAGGLVYDRSFLGIERTDGIVIIQITLAEGRTRDQKKKLYKQISDTLSDELDIRPEDVFVGTAPGREETATPPDGSSHTNTTALRARGAEHSVGERSSPT